MLTELVLCISRYQTHQKSHTWQTDSSYWVRSTLLCAIDFHPEIKEYVMSIQPNLDTPMSSSVTTEIDTV